MSQVNKFNQSNNPDFIYFDLQQANIYNTTEQEQQPLRFSETRETPIVANSGDYHVSVARFQLDTYNLPVLVGEPDLTQTGTYDPDQTIYKVALTAKAGTLNVEAQAGGYALTSQIQQQSQSVDYGEIVITANTGTKDNICVLVTDRSYVEAGNTNMGRVYIWKGTPAANSIAHILSVPTETNYPFIGWGAGISDDGTKAVAGSNGRGVFLFNLTTGVVSPTYSAVIKPYTTLTKVALSGSGTRLFIGSRRVNGVSWARAFVYNYDTQTTVGAEITGYDDLNDAFEKGVYFNTAGDWFITSSYSHDNNRGYVEMRTYNSTSNTWPIVSTGNQFTSNIGDRLGSALAISGDGLYAFASAIRTNDTGNYVRVYKRTGNVFAVVTNISATVNLQQWGKSISASYDGSTLIVSSNNALINIYKRNTGLETYTLYDTLGTLGNFSLYNYFNSISINKTGDAIFSTNTEKIYPAQTLPVTIYNWTYSPPIPAGTSTLPTFFTTTPTIQPLTWIKDEKETSTAPNKNVLTGKNTALYPYYYCNSYGNFITMLNKALKLAYKNLIQSLWTQWVEPLGTEIENQFIDIVTKHYPTPPFIDWNETNLTADAYVSLLFETYQSAANTLISNINNINYSMPTMNWVYTSPFYTGTPKLNTPLKFELAFNAPLYSLFSSFPSKQSILTHPVSGHKEIYYTLNFFSSGLGLVNPSPNLNSIVDYSFLTAYTNATTGVITFSSTGTKDYSHQRLLIKQVQEISTIDTWTPINAIVFTTSLPIVLNQFSATSSIGSNLPSSKQDSAFGFVLTDLQSNQQGFRPNVLYVPTAEYRKLDLNGNQPIKNIEINVYWRSKTGDLIPITLASGAMASIKLLFEKKILAENQKINRGSANVRNII